MFTSCCTCCSLAMFGMYMWAQLERAACEADLKQCSHGHSIPTGTVSQMTKSINPMSIIAVNCLYLYQQCQTSLIISFQQEVDELPLKLWA